MFIVSLPIFNQKWLGDVGFPVIAGFLFISITILIIGIPLLFILEMKKLFWSIMRILIVIMGFLSTGIIVYLLYCYLYYFPYLIA